MFIFLKDSLNLVKRFRFEKINKQTKKKKKQKKLEKFWLIYWF